MMLSEKKIKEIRGGQMTTKEDELIGIRQVFIDDRSDKGRSRDIGNDQFWKCMKKFPNYGGDELPQDVVDVEDLDQHQANFAWTEEDGNIANLVDDFSIGLDTTLHKEIKQEPDTTTNFCYDSDTANVKSSNQFRDGNFVSSTTGDDTDIFISKKQPQLKVQKDDPRSRQHFVKFVKRHGRNIKLWECGICSREFQHQYTLMRHLPTHTDERNFHCDFCGKSFRQHSTLSQHKAIHSAERPYSCEVCSKTFNRVSTLISHRKTHSDDKPYRCHMCPKGFHQKGNLRNHLFTHTNERPYRCNVCSKGFNQQSNLVCHKLKAHHDNGINPIIRKQEDHLNSTELSRSVPESSKVGSNSPNILRKSYQMHWHKAIMNMNASNRTEKQNVKKTESATRKSYKTTNSFQESVPLSAPVNLRARKPEEEFIHIDLNAIPTYQMDMTVVPSSGPIETENTPPILLKLVNVEGIPTGPALSSRKGNRVESQIVTINNIDNHTKRHELQIRIPLSATMVPRTENSVSIDSMNVALQAMHSSVSTDAMFGEGCMRRLEETTGDNESSSEAILKPDLRESCQSYPDDLTGLEDVILNNDRSLILRPSCSPHTLGSSLVLDLLPSSDLFDPMDSIPMGPQLTPVDTSSDDSDMLIGDWKNIFQFSDSDDLTLED